MTEIRIQEHFVLGLEHLHCERALKGIGKL